MTSLWSLETIATLKLRITPEIDESAVNHAPGVAKIYCKTWAQKCLIFDRPLSDV